MNLLRVALLQLLPSPDQAAAQAKGDEFCRQAKARGADIALFPEMWNTGYRFGASPGWPAQAIGSDDPFVLHFRALARELDMAIALTYLERWTAAKGRLPSPGGLLPPRDSVSLIDRRGNIALTYAKVHTCDFDREAALTPGDGFPVATLDTAAGPVEVGAMICFDREFPESARILMLEGAELILVPNACDLESNRLSQLRTRAYENMVGLATANYAKPSHSGNGHSAAFDGIAFEGEDGPSRDTLVVEAGEAEGIYLATFDLARLRAYRSREVWGAAYRKPALYGRLTKKRAQAMSIQRRR